MVIALACFSVLYLGAGEKGIDLPLATRITLRGEYDVWRRSELQQKLEGVDLTDDLLIDMSDVTLMDAGSVGQLIALRHRMLEQTPKARVILLNVSRIVQRVLDLAGAKDLFVLTSDR
jgi:anti-anti-sigma factor